MLAAKPHTTPADGKGNERGFALVSVLLGVALLAAIALAVSSTFRLEVKARAHLARSAEARLLADGLAHVVALRLGERNWLDRFRQETATDGMTAQCKDGDAGVAITIIDAAGLIDLNAAPLALMERLLAGLDKERAPALAAAIVDFRDADDVPLPNGAEAEAYRAAGLPHGPKNDLFETVAELDQVLGVTPELYARLRSLVTVHSRQPGVDFAASPSDLLALLAGRPIDGTGGNGSLRERMAREPALLPMEFRARSQSRTFIVRIGLQQPGGARFQREAVVDLAPQAAGGIGLREWAAPIPPLIRALPERLVAPTCRELISR